VDREAKSGRPARGTGTPTVDPDAAKRAQLYRAAEPLFARFGYRKTTVEEICRAAGMSKRTFYDLFPNKAVLVLRMLIHLSETMIDRWRRETADLRSTAERIDRVIDLYLLCSRSHPVFRLLFEEPEILSRFPEISSALRQSPLMTLVRATIEEGIESGEFRSLDPETGTWIFYSILDSMFFLVPAMTGRTDALQDDELIDEVRAFIRGALAGGGRGRS